ncbi:MAG: XrtA/PEP-CTERM system histidine kinase PrsK [Candidatus Competibacteraceae bacterium]
MLFGAISYSISALGFLLLFLLLLTNWRGRLQGALLVMAVFTTLLSAAAAAYYAVTGFETGAAWYMLFEIARSIAWLAFLLQLLKPLVMVEGPLASALRWRYYLLFLATGLAVLADWWPYPLDNKEFGFALSSFTHISLAIVGLTLIEQLFRNTRLERRWATKFLYLGIGTLFVYDFFLYSDALLFRHMDLQIWSARGLINALVVPLIAVAAARNPSWSLDIFVSRRIVIHSVSILGAGLYLLLMAGVGYYIRLYGGTWGTALQLIFLVGAGLLLLALLFSGQLRAATKLFLSKHFFNYKYDYREEWLKFITTLSSNNVDIPLRERPIHAIAAIVHSTGGMLWSRAEAGHFRLIANWNMREQGNYLVPTASPLVTFLEQRQWLIDLDAFPTEPELYAGLVLPEWLQQLPQTWLVLPLLQGENLKGFMILARPLARHRLTWEDHDLLLTAGRQAASYLALLDATDALLDARQFEAFNRLSAYVVHDLKNIAAQLSLLVANAARHKHKPAFVEDAIRTVENATNRMNVLLAQLRKGSGQSQEASSVFNLVELLQEVIQSRSARRPVPVLAHADPGLCLLASRERFAAVLEHLIQNAQEASAGDGKVELMARRAGTMVALAITDNGCGMDARFIRERLFRPFNTTKGNAGMGIGVYESREFVQALGGTIEVTSTPGMGTTFLLRLPLAESNSASPIRSSEAVT